MDIQKISKAMAEKGLRPTPQRLAVYQYLLTHPIHPTADTIYQALVAQYPTFSRTTIYNSLRSLVEIQLVRTVNIEAEEQRFDGNPTDHGHFRCTHCGRIYDFDVDEKALQQMCPTGFQAEIKDVFFNGICAACSHAVVQS